ncbi:hypothetical protein KPH14_012795, partial [Odynerus spinipes]
MGAPHGQLFYMFFNMKKTMECNVVNEHPLKLWHERLGHVNSKMVREAEKTGAVNGMKIKGTVDGFVCETCVLGKQSRKTHPSNKLERQMKTGEMIHSDVCGPVSVESPRGS